MASKTFTLEIPPNAWANGAGSHSIVIKTTDGLAPAGGSVSGGIRYIDNTGTSNIDWANSYINMFMDYGNSTWTNPNLVKKYLNAVSFKSGELSLDADGEAFSITKTSAFNAYFSNWSNYVGFNPDTGFLTHTKSSSEFPSWWGNSGQTGTKVEWQKAGVDIVRKFRTASSLTAFIKESGSEYVYKFSEISLDSHTYSTPENKLYFNRIVNYDFKYDTRVEEEFALSAATTFDQVAVFIALQGSQSTPLGTVSVAVHNVSRSVLSSNPARTPEASGTVQLTIDNTEYLTTSAGGRGVFVKFPSSVTLSGTCTLVITNNAGNLITKIGFLSGASGNTTYYNGSAMNGTRQPFVLGMSVPSNTAPSDISLSLLAILENAAPGSTVGILSATDLEANASTFSIVGGAHQSMFVIDGSSLKLAAGALLDHESVPSLSVQIKVSDGEFEFTKSLQIAVNNVNEAPPGISLSGLSIREAMPVGTLVGLLSSVDPEGDAITYSVVENADKFEIVGVNELKSKVIFDRDAAGSAESHSVKIRASDSSNPSIYVEQSFSISIQAWAGDNPVTVTQSAGSSLAFVVIEAASDPMQGLVTLSGGAALPSGSVVKFQGKRYLKVEGSASEFVMIEPIAKAEWEWSDSVEEVWVQLQSM
jgi:hypothetical protein